MTRFLIFMIVLAWLGVSALNSRSTSCEKTCECIERGSNTLMDRKYECPCKADSIPAGRTSNS